MRKISITISETNTQTIHLTEHEDWEEDGFCADFFIVNKNIPEKEYLYIVKKQSANLKWLNVEGNRFIFDLGLLKQTYDKLFIDCDWMKGMVCLPPHNDIDIINKIPVVSFHMSKGEIEMNTPKKIFLSHKSSNKPMVRNYFNLLKELGYEPWLDEDAMVAGVNPDRGIVEGFKDSCACVFFITPEFKDEKFLADEIDNARHEKRQKGDKFSIITLQFQDEHGNVGVVPELLQRAIWKTPSNELEAFKEIVRALPIKLGSPIWR
ncbi:toll/interleukin-1 receptor domain-containing protein [Paenibacillus apiarius]|uniref:toll/interleukin-1 receptor domain-containing protein n=1 Tax=Paenibacillus apiarius TaxID=46240 RepID=UPI00197CFC0F|nr:toll/interleukin-1 receptor domain-containing protein [Paenibacillus apiarius]MBN3525061.1 toll/interleukin-1 receptor domain-containing protein [Paenibacillus apiarius]